MVHNAFVILFVVPFDIREKVVCVKEAVPRAHQNRNASMLDTLNDN
jgi:hypothetical protein